MNRFINKVNQGLSILVLATIALPTLTGCTGGGIFNTKLFRERAAETPEPNEQIIDKSFFVEASGKPKTFLCAWAPEIGRGTYGEAANNPYVNQMMHCNVEFEVTESALIAKVINPSFLNDRSRWQQLLSIPITKHFYYERDKDKYGRETNDWIENSSRSHWSARPKMKIDLNSMRILDFGGGWGTEVSTNIEEIEWDQANNFLGFSFNSYRSNPILGANYDAQARWRVNFLKFEHDSTFVKVPYHQENSRLMNILHVMGRMVDGVEPELYAAHWDLRKPTRVYLSGVPKEHQNTVALAIDKWNRELRKIGAIEANARAFIPVIKDLKHPFDLRYPSITWISDRRISSNGPLGIGMAHADVRNGKIIWGGIVLFGGYLDRYINAMTPTDSGSGTSNSATSGESSALTNPFNSISALMPSTMPGITALQDLMGASRTDLMRNISVDHQNFLSQEMALLGQRQALGDSATIETLKAQMQAMQISNPGLNQMVADLVETSRAENQKATDFFKQMTLQKLLGSVVDQSATSLKDALTNSGNKAVSDVVTQTDEQKRSEMMKRLGINGSPMFSEDDLTAENQFPAAGASTALRARSFPEVLESVVMSLTIHEFGHMIGLGHQFKENIIPEPGTAPSSVIKELSAKANREQEFTNYTSVMGYMNGRTEMMMPVEQINPGVQDSLVLHYLYKSEYAIYNNKADRTDFKPIPVSGRVPDFTQTSNGEMRSGYYPQCNDFEASLASDPFCNRFDRGNKAEDLVNSYFDTINDNLLANLYSLVGGGANESYAENRLWNMAFGNFSRVRLFYDEMRRRLRSEPHLKNAWNKIRSDKDALFEFSRGCMQADPTSASQVKSEDLRTVFKDKHIVDLCRANSLALKEFRFFLNLPQSDYTKIDHNNRYVQGGYLAGDVSKNYGHAFGSWYQMSNLPLKIAALYTLTTANSYLLWGGIWSNPFYDNEENRYLYRTLFPTEYTKMISDTIQNNLRFAATGKDDTTTMGRAVLAAGWMLPLQRYTSNDSARLPREYNELLDQQTEFKFSLVAVIIDATKPDASSNVKADHYKKFTATVYDFIANKSATAREIFLLPKGDIFAWANGMFIYPISKIKFYSGTGAYVIAYKVSYDDGVKDDLVNDSLKLKLMEKHNEIASYCVNGFDGNGLLNYFDANNANFDGFKILNGIAEERGKEKLTAFYKSLDEEFAKYEASQNPKIPAGFPIRSMRRVCDEAIRGVGQISSAAAMTNGFWTGITADYVEK